MATNGQLPASQPAGNAAHNGVAKNYDAPVNTSSKAAGRSGSRGMNLIFALLLAVAVALSAAPASGYKSGWAFYRRSAVLVPARLQPLIPIPVTLKIWVGWIKGSNSVTNTLHTLFPDRFPAYRYLRETREGGQVAGGLAIAFLLVGGLVAFFYFLASLLYAIKGGGRRSASPPGMGIAMLIFGLLNMLWSIALYIVISVGTAIYTRQTFNATYIAWPDWCFFLAFFSGVFMWIAAFMALAEGRRAKRRLAGEPHMMHNMTYNQPHGTTYSPKTAAV